MGDAVVSEMAEGYRDGLDPESPSPSANRAAAYRHGYANGRDDLAGSPRALARALRAQAKAAEEEDKRR